MDKPSPPPPKKKKKSTDVTLVAHTSKNVTIGLVTVMTITFKSGTICFGIMIVFRVLSPEPIQGSQHGHPAKLELLTNRATILSLHLIT